MVDLNPTTKNKVIINDDFKRKHFAKPIADDDRIRVDDRTMIILFILGMTEGIDFAQTPIVTLGRFDHRTKRPGQLDLSLYGAVKRGVSRSHCQLEYQNGTIYVTDLGSSNGTFIANKRLAPNQPHLIKKGQELMLGRLPIQFVSGYATSHCLKSPS